MSHFVAFPHDGGAPHGRSGNIQARRPPGRCCCSPALEWPSRVTCMQEAGHQRIGCMQVQGAKPSPRAALPSRPCCKPAAAGTFSGETNTGRGCSAYRDIRSHGNDSSHLRPIILGRGGVCCSRCCRSVRWPQVSHGGTAWCSMGCSTDQPVRCDPSHPSPAPRCMRQRIKECSRKRWAAVANAGERVPALCPGGRCRVKGAAASCCRGRDGVSLPSLVCLWPCVWPEAH